MVSNDHEGGAFIDDGRSSMAGALWLGMVSVALFLGAGEACLAQDTPMSIIAAQVRSQGFACEQPRSAQHDVRASRPNEQVWTLVCENQTYRVTLVPNMAARIEVRK